VAEIKARARIDVDDDLVGGLARAWYRHSSGRRSIGRAGTLAPFPSL